MKYIVQPVVPAHAAMPQYATDRRYAIVAAHSGLVAGVRQGDILLEQQNWEESERQQWRIERIPDGIDADLLAIDRDGRLCKRVGWYGAWEAVPGGPKLRGLVVTREGRLLGVGADHQLYRRENLAAAWGLIPDSGPTLDAAILTNGNIVGVTPDGGLQRRLSLQDPWREEAAGAPLAAVATEPDGALLAVGRDGRIARCAAGSDNWVTVPDSGDLINITTMVDGSWLGVGTDHRLYTRIMAGEPWEPVPGDGEFIAVAAHARYYRIVNVRSGKMMDVRDWSLENEAPIHEWAWHGDFNQQWAVQHLGGGRFKIIARVSGLALDVMRGDTAPGAQLVQYRWHGGLNQQWQLAAINDGDELPYGERATVYEAVDFGGRAQELGVGSYEVAELTIGAGAIGSIRVPDGLRVILYENANFSGDQRRYDEDAPRVGDDFDDGAAGLVVEQVATIFDRQHFQGKRQRLGVGRYNVADLDLGDDAVHSLRVPSGLMVTLFEHADFSGRPRVYTSSAEILDEMMDGVTSSITVKAMGIVIPAKTLRFGEIFALEGEALLRATAGGRLTTGEPQVEGEASFSFTRSGRSKFTAYASFGDIVALTDHAGRFARLHPKGEVRADAGTAAEAARLTIVRAGDTSHDSFVAAGDVIALQTEDGRYLTMTGRGLAAVTGEPDPTRGRWRLTAPPGVIEPPAGDGAFTFCGAAACLANACGTAVCGADAVIIGACGAAANGIGFCALDVAGVSVCGAALNGGAICGADACGAAACGAAACGGAACGAAACGAAACTLDADVIGACPTQLSGIGLCGAEACGADACGAEASGGTVCGGEACGADACGLEACGAEACAAEACPVEACPADACLANACAINLCPADACLADACAVDLIPIIPGI